MKVNQVLLLFCVSRNKVLKVWRLPVWQAKIRLINPKIQKSASSQMTGYRIQELIHILTR